MTKQCEHCLKTFKFTSLDVYKEKIEAGIYTVYYPYIICPYCKTRSFIMPTKI